MFSRGLSCEVAYRNDRTVCNRFLACPCSSHLPQMEIWGEASDCKEVNGRRAEGFSGSFRQRSIKTIYKTKKGDKMNCDNCGGEGWYWVANGQDDKGDFEPCDICYLPAEVKS